MTASTISLLIGPINNLGFIDSDTDYTYQNKKENHQLVVDEWAHIRHIKDLIISPSYYQPISFNNLLEFNTLHFSLLRRISTLIFLSLISIIYNSLSNMSWFTVSYVHFANHNKCHHYIYHHQSPVSNQSRYSYHP